MRTWLYRNDQIYEVLTEVLYGQYVDINFINEWGRTLLRNVTDVSERVSCLFGAKCGPPQKTKIIRRHAFPPHIKNNFPR